MNSFLRSAAGLKQACVGIQRSSFAMKKSNTFLSSYQQMCFFNTQKFLSSTKQEIKIGGEELKEEVPENVEINTTEQEQPVEENTTTTEEFSSGPVRLSNIVGGERDTKYEVFVPPVFTNLPMNQVRELQFAVVQVEGHQYKVTNGDRITVNRVPVEVGTQINLNKILLVGGKDFSAIGRPIVSNATVLATVEQHTRSAYTIAFKKRRRKNSKRWKGFQQQVTTLRIDDVKFNTEAASDAQLKVACYE